MRRTLLVTSLALAACGPETTSFRTTDRGDGIDRGTPPAAAYDLDAVAVHVWSNGGYIGASDEPMTHVGFEIRNAGPRSIVFDANHLQLAVFGRDGRELPPAAFVAVTPLGPAQLPIAAGATTPLDVYFKLPVRPRAVERMRVGWAVTIDDEVRAETTSFVRDDVYPTLDPSSAR
jgi:hypothetical protein